jgi:16S rRNA (adenine1518-N6/adenine1519-N6)-dimethyltransferase
MSRKWGQHFLRSPKTVERILRAASLTKQDVVLEIGPGEGVLTAPLCQVAEHVHAFEIDPMLAGKLEGWGCSNLSVHRGDFLRLDPSELLGSDSGRDLVVVANLPYYITAPILERLLWQRPVKVIRAILMMQEEVAQRLCHPASRTAGALSYIAGAFFEAEYLFKVPPGCFSPPPKVDSAVIGMTPRERYESTPAERRTFERLVSTAFQTRRKQLGRSLRSLKPNAPELLQRAGIESDRRPETLTVQEFWNLTRNWPCE